MDEEKRHITDLTGAGSVEVARLEFQQVGSGAIPTPALHSIEVRPISMGTAKGLIERNHDSGSLSGGTRLSFGAFLGSRLLGAITFGAGPYNGYRLVDDAKPMDCLTLTRLWLSDDLPRNSESRVLGVSLRSLKKHTSLKFLVTYADPAQGHRGVIYQASGWMYTGLSERTPLYRINGGRPRHSRTVSHAFGTHSVKYFVNHGLDVIVVPQSSKHRYIYFVIGGGKVDHAGGRLLRNGD